ncbi:DMT family transporter [Allobacillus sp. SKP2-8]|uniref:DMT family transporter n=1 Tax=unclassified Allobacillus TaxID=2628859 RepID=UPI00118277F9|nr:DMT family transporter [Allobacillus sp. SKP2-8]TSJ66916.1 DMT family transporter [Allobacillus sp. SKP2-8]
MVRSYIFVLIAVTIFSSNLVVGKAVSHMSPVTVVFFRLFIAFLVTLPIGYKQVKYHMDIWKENWKYLFAFAVTGISFFNFFVYLSLNYTSSTNAGIVEATTPVFSIFLGYFILKERLTRRQLIGAGISFIGAIWVIANGSLEVLLALDFNIGDIFMIVAVLIWAIYGMYVKQHNHKFPVYGGVVIMLGMGFLIILPFAIANWIINGFHVEITDYKGIAGLLYLGIFPSVIGLIFWNKSVSNLGPSLASIFLNLLPVFTTIMAVIFLNEKLVPAQIFGGILVVGGVLLVNLNLKNIKRFSKKDKKAIETTN